jgi:hypothetical protein
MMTPADATRWSHAARLHLYAFSGISRKPALANHKYPSGFFREMLLVLGSEDSGTGPYRIVPTQRPGRVPGLPHHSQVRSAASSRRSLL